MDNKMCCFVAKGRASISKCGRYRYTLSRIWDVKKEVVLFIMLNPSTADAFHNDATVKKCVGFANGWGFGGFCVVNLFAFRTAFPTTLFNNAAFNDIVGPRNNYIIRTMSRKYRYNVVAWGAKGNFMYRGKQVLEMLPKAFTYCIGKTRDGHPLHPSRTAYTQRPILFW